MATSYLPIKEAELGQWTAHFVTQATALQASIGITTGQIAALTAANSAWIAALSAATAEATRSKPTIVTKNTTRDAVIAIIRPLVREIQSYPGTTNTMRSQLGITVPKIPTPAGNPGTPYQLKATLTSTGNVELSWKNKNASGCVYTIYRQVGGSGDYVALGGVGSKKFTDTTIPAGTTQIQYHIQAVRPTGVSAWAVLDVKFGNGTSEIEATEQEPVKIAA